MSISNASTGVGSNTVVERMREPSPDKPGSLVPRGTTFPLAPSPSEPAVQVERAPPKSLVLVPTSVPAGGVIVHERIVTHQKIERVVVRAAPPAAEVEQTQHQIACLEGLLLTADRELGRCRESLISEQWRCAMFICVLVAVSALSFLVIATLALSLILHK